MYKKILLYPGIQKFILDFIINTFVHTEKKIMYSNYFIKTVGNTQMSFGAFYSHALYPAST